MVLSQQWPCTEVIGGEFCGSRYQLRENFGNEGMIQIVERNQGEIVKNILNKGGKLMDKDTQEEEIIIMDTKRKRAKYAKIKDTVGDQIISDCGL